MGRLILDLEKIRDLYVNQEKTILEIAKILNVSCSVIQRRLESLGIERRKKLDLDMEDIVELYVNQREPAAKVGRILGASQQTISRRLQELKIKIRKSKITPEIVKKTLELRKKGLNMYKIAKEVPISARTVQRLLSKELGKDYKKVNEVVSKEILKKVIELRKKGYTIFDLEKALKIKRATIEYTLRKHMGQKEFKKYVNYCVLEYANLRHNKAKKVLKKYLKGNHNFIKIKEERALENGKRPDFITILKNKDKISWDVVVSNSDLKNLEEEIKKKFSRGYEKYSKLCFIILFSNLNDRKNILKKLQSEAPKGIIILDSDFMLSDKIIAPLIPKVINFSKSELVME